MRVNTTFSSYGLVLTTGRYVIRVSCLCKRSDETGGVSGDDFFQKDFSMDLADKALIREIKSEDADQISRIQASITKADVTIDFKKIIEDVVENDEEAAFVAEFEGKVVGYMITYILLGGFGIEKSAWIAMFGVDPKFMGQGIGKKLAEVVFEFYGQKGISNIHTSVMWDSTDLLSFFKTLGFDRSEFINLRKKLE
jgi:ribosomal protein S18 acetylase RimI-like enzyme